MALTKAEAVDFAMEVAKVMLASSSCVSIYPSESSAKDVAAFIRTLADELSAM